MSPEDQLTLIQLGVFISRFLKSSTLPQSVEEVRKVINDNLDVKIQRHDKFSTIREKVIAAIERQYTEEREYYHTYEDAVFEASSKLAKEIDKEIINNIIGEAEEEQHIAFDEAMKIV